MKLLLFILGLTLCASWPSFRNLGAVNEEETSLDFTDGELGEFAEYDIFGDADNNHDIGSIFDTNFHLNEEGEVELSFGEENTEEYFPSEPVEEEEENNNEQPIDIPDNTPVEDLLTQIRKDAVANDVFQFGVNTIIARGTESKKIPNEPFTVTEVTSYSKSGDTSGDIYKFSSVATNADGSAVLNMNFNVYYRFTDQRKTLSSWSYNITTTTNPTAPVGEFVQLSEEEVKSEAVQAILTYGVAQVLAVGVEKGKIPASEFAVTSVVGVWKQVAAKGANYRCEVVLNNNNNVAVFATFTVHQSTTQQNTLSQYEYTVKNVDNTTPTNPTNPTNNTNNTNTDGYTTLTADEIANDVEVQSVLAWGSNQIIQYGYDKKKIPVSEYVITKINSVARRIRSNGRNAYKCDVELQDVKKALIEAKFTVYLNVSSQEKSMGSWSYNISNIKNNGSGNSTNTTNPTNPTNPTNNTNTTQPDTNTTNPTNPTNPTNNTNTTQPDTNTTNPTNPTNNTNTTTDPFTALTADEIAGSAEVQTALNYGVNETIQYGFAKNKIPVSTYSITKVISVGKQVMDNRKRNAYKCSVEAEDPRGVLVKAQYTVYVTVSNQALFLKSWAYQVFNLRYADDPLPGTNTTNTTNTTQPTTNNTTPNPTTPTTPTNPTDDGNTTQPTTNTTVNNTTPDNTNNNNNTTPNNTNTTTPQPTNNGTNTTVSNYTALTAEEIASNAEVQGALDFGVNQTLLYGYAKNKIPISDYKITKINSVGRQAISNGRNSYKCDIELQDVNKVLVKAQFVVNVKVATQDKSLSTWSYQVSGVKNNSNNNNNSTKTL